ncbi:hypothetical protein ACWGOE_00650 [Leucobacter chromiiresistens]
MSEKRISLADGFEDLLGTLRGLAGECPSAGEMTRVDGSESGLGVDFYRALVRSGRTILSNISELDQKLELVEKNMSEAIADYRETDASIAEDVKRILAELEGVRVDVTGEDTKAPEEKQQSRKLGRAN